MGLDPHHPYSCRALARAWMRLAEAGHAKGGLRRAVAADPCWAESRIARVDASMSLGRHGQTLAVQEHAIARNPECLGPDGPPGLSFALDRLTVAS